MIRLLITMAVGVLQYIILMVVFWACSVFYYSVYPPEKIDIYEHYSINDILEHESKYGIPPELEEKK
jgi:hypothetical protein